MVRMHLQEAIVTARARSYSCEFRIKSRQVQPGRLVIPIQPQEPSGRPFGLDGLLPDGLGSPRRR